MAVYLVDNPPRIQQYRCPRRRTPSGIIGVHTAESFPDETGPDTGAENVAAFIARRTNHGSYHLLADSDSVIQLVEFSCVAYHIGTHGLNEHTIGVSAATQAAKWNSLGDEWVRATVRNMARAAVIAARWLQRTHGITVPARRITLSQALNGQKGFLAHGDADPARRTDPGKSFPWTQFLTDYAAFMASQVPTIPEDDMPYSEAQLKKIFQDALADASKSNGLAIFHERLQSQAEKAVLAKAGTGVLGAGVGGQQIAPGVPLTVGIALQRIYNHVTAGSDPIDEAQLARLLAEELVPLILAGLPDGSDLDQATVEAALRNVLGSLDES